MNGHVFLKRRLLHSNSKNKLNSGVCSECINERMLRNINGKREKLFEKLKFDLK